MADTEPLQRAFPKARRSTLAKVPERFWSKVEKGEGCWRWTAYCNAAGYGVSNVASKRIYATHLSLLLSGQERPEGGIALHSCDNPGCVNPAHLAWGTHAQNTQEMVERGRRPEIKGERHGQAKLTEENVRFIRKCGLSLREMQEIFGVSIRVLSLARAGKTWSHVDA